MRNRIVVAAALLALLVAGCGGGGSSSSSSGAVNPNTAEQSPPGDIPDNQAYVAYKPPGAGFTVKVPEGWSRSASGGAVTFTDKLNSIRIESAPASAAPTAAQATQTDVPKLAKAVKGFQAGKVSEVSRKSGKAVRITYLADATANTVTGKAGQDAIERYVFFHNGTDAILTLSGPKGADNVDPWRIITDSVTWTR
jgi:hypothetical protein